MSDVTPLTDADLAEIEARVAAAEYGPWFNRVRIKTDSRDRDREFVELFAACDNLRPIARFFPQREDERQERSWGAKPSFNAVANCAFAAGARIDVVRLIAEVKRLRSPTPASR